MKTFKQFLEEEHEIYAKQLGAVPDWAPQFAEGNYRIGDITFSAKDGLGSVPFNQSVYYHGLVGEIKPSVFFDLVLQDDSKDVRAKEIAKLILKGYAIGIPFITIDTKKAENMRPCMWHGRLSHRGVPHSIAQLYWWRVFYN